jgi:GNAT superfamily N-acetyltransferase
MLNAEAVRRSFGENYRVVAPQPGVVDLARLDDAGAVLCAAQLRDHGHAIAVRDLETVEARRGEGIGTQVLNDISAWADSEGLSLTIWARHGAQRNPDHDRRLTRWLSSRGFLSAGGITMVRCPGGWQP